jgi:hypothetical protein
MPSKQVSDLKKGAAAVTAAAETHAERIAQALQEQLHGHLGAGETMPDLALVVRLLGRHLDGARAQMETADEAHEAELRDDQEPRDLRDKMAVEVYERLIGLRDSTVAMYGVGVARELGLVGETPTDPVVLLRQGTQVANALSKIKLPPSRLPGTSLDPAALRTALMATLGALEGHLNDVARETREAQATLTAKHRAINNYTRNFSGTADALSGLLLIAGEPELAERVRPSRRRPGQTEEDTGGTPSEGGSEPSGGMNPAANTP